MGWRRDWLYALVFEKIRNEWPQTMAYAKHIWKDKPITPYYWLVYECANGDTEKGFCSGGPFRIWKYSGSLFEPLVPLPDTSARVTQQGRMWSSGAVEFYIAPNRRQVVLTMNFGPLYGCGYTFDVQGQGKKATLNSERRAMRWIS